LKHETLKHWNVKRIRNEDKHHQEKKVLKIIKGKETYVRINIGGKEIEQVKEFCYLGV